MPAEKFEPTLRKAIVQ